MKYFTVALLLISQLACGHQIGKNWFDEVLSGYEKGAFDEFLSANEKEYQELFGKTHEEYLSYQHLIPSNETNEVFGVDSSRFKELQHACAKLRKCTCEKIQESMGKEHVFPLHDIVKSVLEEKPFCEARDFYLKLDTGIVKGSTPLLRDLKAVVQEYHFRLKVLEQDGADRQQQVILALDKFKRFLDVCRKHPEDKVAMLIQEAYEDYLHSVPISHDYKYLLDLGLHKRPPENAIEEEVKTIMEQHIQNERKLTVQLVYR